MLTPEQITAIRDRAEQIAAPVTEYLLEDIARRVSEAAQLTSTASYQIWRVQNLGLSQKEIKKRLSEILKVSESEIEQLLRQSAEVGYNFDISNLPTAASIPFEQNAVMQQIVNAAVNMAKEDFGNITNTLGLVEQDGRAEPLTKAYKTIMDNAFTQVATGAADYNTAIRRATAKLADNGIRTISYESGVHRSIEAATRGCVMGALGLMQEQISQNNHDMMGADGWEISAHAASAPDHEPIQGRQYSDREFEKLNNSLARRIGTLNCGHAAFPIILGVSSPMHSEEELAQMRRNNSEGITYEGKHYTMYEATQMQRRIERAMRRQKNHILIAKSQVEVDTEKVQIHQIRLRRLSEEYKRFSKAAGLPTQYERQQVAGFDWKEAAQAKSTADKHYKEWSKSIGLNNTYKTLDKYNDLKYTNSPEYELTERYIRGVKNGWVSPNAGFDNYRMLYNQVENELVGHTTANGITITGQTEHFMQRVLGTMDDPIKHVSRSGVGLEDIKDALFNPERISDNKLSISFVGKTCRVSVNPDTGKLIQTNPRKDKKK